MSLWIWLLSPLIGLLLALFGAGGGMTTVPLLSHALHMPIREAVASSLWIVASVSLAALIRQQAWSLLNYRLLAWLAGGGLIGSWLGAQAGLVMPAAIQSALFGALTWFVAWWMQRPKPETAQHGDTICHCMRTLITGVCLGIITGVLGVGGGFLMVPALLWLGVSDYRCAVAHSLLLITANALAAGISYLGAVSFQPGLLVIIALLAMTGSVIGSRLLRYWPVAKLQKAFSLLLLVIGGVMLWDASRMWAL